MPNANETGLKFKAAGMEVEIFAKETSIDKHAEAAKHGAKSRGREDAMKGLPRESASEFSSNESFLVGVCQDHVNELSSRIEIYIASRYRDLRSIKTRFIKPNFYEPIQTAREDIQSIQQKSRYDLKTLGAASKRATRSTRFFRDENRIRRDPIVPEETLRVVAFVTIVFLLEAFAGTYLFASVNPIGIVGGFLEAAGLSIINIGWSFAAGFIVYRHVRSRNSTVKVLAIFGIVMHVVGVLAINFLAAHYRDSGSLQIEGKVARTVEQLTENWFEFNDVLSLAIPFLGIVFAIVATRKGMTIHDPIPEYGRLGVIDRFNETAYKERLDVANEEVDDSLRNCVQTIEAALKNRRDLAAEASGICDDLCRLANIFNTAFEQRTSFAAYLLKDYREGNIAVRTEPSPEYFSYDSVSLSKPSLSIDGLDFLEVAADMSKDLEIWENTATKAREDMLDKAAEARKSFEHFVTSVDDEAEKEMESESADMDKARSSIHIDRIKAPRIDG